MPAIPQLHLYIREDTPPATITARRGGGWDDSDGSPCSPEAFVTLAAPGGCVSKARDADLCPGH